MKNEKSDPKAALNSTCKGTQFQPYLQGDAAFSDDVVKLINNVKKAVEESEASIPLPSLVSIHEAVTKPTFLLNYKGTEFLPIGNIFIVQGQKKVGKSKALQALCAVLLGATWGALEKTADVDKLLYFDTEQERCDTIGVLRNILALLEWRDENPDKLRVYCQREKNYDERKTEIETEIEAQKPQVVVIDGIADIEPDFNDVVKCSAVGQWLLNLTGKYKCAVICVLHENKGDENTQGHLGSVLDKKLYASFKVEKKGAAFTFSNVRTRGKDIEPIRFILDTNGVPRPADLSPCDNHSKYVAEAKSVLQKIYTSNIGLGRNALERDYATKSKCSEKTASNRISLAKDEGLLLVGEDSLYYFSEWGKLG